MAEQKKEAGGKDKKSLLDDGIGDEFLGSWKKMSVDDTMDFNIETVPKGGKKKAFNFGNLDMDFNLDGDFDKLPSFKMDMPDLDFSSPDDASKPKGKVDKGSSSGQQKGNLDAFNISFDFNGFDSFNLDGDVIKGDGKAPATKQTDKNGAAMTGSEHHDPKILIAEGAEGSESSQTDDSPASEKINNQVVKAAVASKGIENSFRGDDSKVGTIIEHAAQNSSEEIVGVRTEGKNQQGSSSDVTSIDQSIPSSDEGMPTDQSAEYALQSTASQSLGGSESIQDGLSDVPSEVDCLDSRPMESDAEHHHIGITSINENQKQLRKAAPLDTNGQESKKGVNREIFPTEGMKETDPVSTGRDSEAISIGTLPVGKPNDCPISEDNQKSSPTDLPTENQSVTDEGTITKEEGVRVVQSKFFRKSGDVRPPLASSGLRISSIGSSELAVKQLNHLGSMKPDNQTGRNPGGQLKSLSSEFRKGVPPALPIGRNNVKSTSTISVSRGCKDDGAQDGSVLTDTPIPSGKVVAKGLQSEGNASSSVDKMPKLNIQRSMKSPLAALSTKSVQSSRIVPVNTLKSERQMLPNISSFRLSRNVVANRDQLNVPNKTLKGFSKIIEAQQNAASSKMTQPVTHEQRSKSLKRNSEAFNTDLVRLNPHKRLSPSRDEMRVFDEKTERISGNQVHSTESEVEKEHGSMPHDRPISGFTVPQEVNLDEPKIDRIKMASEYSRKLDELCNMLKKMNVEAKELMVRSIVTNNRLLLLNHPELDEKIRIAERNPGKSADQ